MATYALISSVGVLPSGCATLCYAIDAQVFLQPQLVSQWARCCLATSWAVFVTVWRVRVIIVDVETEQCIPCVLLSYMSLATI